MTGEKVYRRTVLPENIEHKGELYKLLTVIERKAAQVQNKGISVIKVITESTKNKHARALHKFSGGAAHSRYITAMDSYYVPEKDIEKANKIEQ